MTNPIPKAETSTPTGPQLWQPPADAPIAPLQENAPFNPRQTMMRATPATPMAPTHPQAGPPAYAGHAHPPQPLPPRQPHATPAQHYPQTHGQGQAHTHQHLQTQPPYSPPPQSIRSRQGYPHNPHGTAAAAGFAGPDHMPAQMPTAAPAGPTASRSLFKRLLKRKPKPSGRTVTPQEQAADDTQPSSLKPFLAGLTTGIAVMFLGMRLLGGGEPEPAMLSPEPFAEAAPATGTFIEGVVTESDASE